MEYGNTITNFTFTLVERLKSDPVFRYTCGFPVASKTPSEATFSRFTKSLSDNLGSLEDILEELVVKAKELGMIDGEHIAIDTSKLDSYDASVPKSRIIHDGEHPDWGSKRGTHGSQIRWFGWKIHAAVDTKSELPVTVRVTPASVNDGIVAIPLVEDIKQRYADIIDPKYYMMDMGYDYDNIYRIIHDQYNARP
ncbi:MAG: transposase [Clostridia bacterium]